MGNIHPFSRVCFVLVYPTHAQAHTHRPTCTDTCTDMSTFSFCCCFFLAGSTSVMGILICACLAVGNLPGEPPDAKVPCGPQDQMLVYGGRSDVLLFNSAPLQQEVAITGVRSVPLWGSSFAQGWCFLLFLNRCLNVGGCLKRFPNSLSEMLFASLPWLHQPDVSANHCHTTFNPSGVEGDPVCWLASRGFVIGIFSFFCIFFPSGSWP